MTTAAEIATKQRYVHLLSKVKGNIPLSRAELKELTKYEAMAKKEKKTIIEKPKTQVKKKAKRPPKKTAKAKTSPKKTVKKTEKAKKTAPKTTKSKAKKTKKRMPVSVAMVKKLGLQYDSLTEAAAKIKTTMPLAECLSGWPKLKAAWDRGRLLRNIAEEASNAASIAEAEDALEMDHGELNKMIAEDIEVHDIWTQQRLKFSRDLKKIVVDQAKEGKVSAVNRLINMLRNELAGKTAIDLDRLSLKQMDELGFNKQNLHNWHTKQGMPRNSDGTFSLKAFIPWLIKFEVAKATKGYTATGAEPDGLRMHRAEMYRLNVAKEKAELLSRDEVIAGLAARHQMMTELHKRFMENAARTCQHQPIEQSKKLLADGLSEVSREMCNVPAMLKLEPEAEKKFKELLEMITTKTSEQSNDQ